MDIQVTSVTKKSQSLSDSAAAIFVITNEDLKRSGVTNIPDALRMVPGINVARIDSNKWAISARGFNSRLSAKLLVLIDGRSVYTPTFSGVYWEVNDVLLEDVERIEVIRGPGATLWGANAVNGVINIITKHSQDTQGGILSVGTGDFEKAITSARYGSSFGENSHWRVYAKNQERDEFKFTTGEDANDDWKITQAGFRIDSKLNKKNDFTFQGDIYQGDINQELILITTTSPFMDTFSVETDVSGANLLSRWQHTLSSTSNFSLQVYYDTTKRTEDFVGQERDSWDMEFQHSFAAGTNHNFVWGLRYRYMEDEFTNTSVVYVDPSTRQDNLYSAFVQDEICFFQERVRLTLGSKFEHNDYSGYEIQPSARVMWAVNSNNKVWGAVSRAVRTPSRGEADAAVSYLAYDLSSLGLGPPGIPFVVTAYGNEEFDSEELMAYELGYRFVPAMDFSVDLTFFYNTYDNNRTAEIGSSYFTGTSLQQDVILISAASGETYGGELALAFRPSEFFKCDLAYSFLKDHFDNDENVGGFPRHQVSLRGQFNLSKTLELDIWFRYVDEANASYLLAEDNLYEIDDYVTMDLRLGWKITPSIEISLVGQNLLDKTHVEFVQEYFSQPVEIERSIYGVLSYRF